MFKLFLLREIRGKLWSHTALGFLDTKHEGWLLDRSQSFTCRNIQQKMELYEPSITSALEDQKKKSNDFTILSVDPVARSCQTW
jgi:hypothetical protein